MIARKRKRRPSRPKALPTHPLVTIAKSLRVAWDADCELSRDDESAVSAERMLRSMAEAMAGASAEVLHLLKTSVYEPYHSRGRPPL